MKPFTGKMIMALALLAPAGLPAFQDHGRDQQSTQSKRYYDSRNKDWHDWNDNENQAYQRYSQESHSRQNRDFSRLSKRQQQNYFQWRHQHSDDHSDNRR